MRFGDTPAASATPLTVTAANPCRANWSRACSRIRCLVAAASRIVMCTSIHNMCMLVHMSDDLQERLRLTRRVRTPWRDDATRGIGGTGLDDLLHRWADGYDWSVHERRIAALPWATVGAGDASLRVVHQR